MLERWVRMGAPDPRTDPAPTSPSRADLDAGRSHWAFRPIAEPPVPRVKDDAWPRTDVDRFILAKLESEGLTPVADADRPTLLRRVFFDLVGVPPTPAEIESFLADDAPDAFEKIVDALLGRPEFGQRWGRHWLDVARYADSNGSDENFTFYDAWRYRNYVIGAFNADKPFDRFLTEQLAGDLLPFRTQKERDDNIVATGFLVVGPKVIGATDKEQLLVDVIDEQLDTIGKAFLGLTIGCGGVTTTSSIRSPPATTTPWRASWRAPRRSTAICSIGAISRAGTCIRSDRAVRPPTRPSWHTRSPSTTG